MSKKPLLTDEQIRRFMKESGWDKLSPEEVKHKVSEELNKLVEQGLVERLIGEDGEFYYRSIKKEG